MKIKDKRMNDVPVEELTEITESERMINLGVPVDTKKLGRLQVKEISLEDTIALAKEIAIVFSAVGDDIRPTDESKGLEWIVKLFGDPSTQQAIRSIIAKSTDREPEDFENMVITDWLKLVVAIKKVFDWEELKELFFQIVPSDTMKNWRSIIR